MLGRTGADAEPDSVWMFGPHLWIGFEAKSESDPGGEVKAERPGRRVATSTTPPPAREPRPRPARAVIISPQDRVHDAAVAVAGAGLPGAARR